MVIKALPLGRKRKIGSADLKAVLIDASEQNIERPQRKQRQYYSGKKTHTIKAQLVVDEQTEEILEIDCAKGKVHDFELYKRSKVHLYPDTEALLDLGYLGIKKIHSNSKIPYKSSKSIIP